MSDSPMSLAGPKFLMDRYWLLSWTTYGSRLPGDDRGFVGNVRDIDGNHVTHNIPGTPYDAGMPGLVAYVRKQMNGPPVTLDKCDADSLILQYQETAKVRKWELCAASVMYNHTHVVIGVPGDPDPQKLLETLKSWATRALTKLRLLPPNGSFWTAKGSKRKLGDEQAICNAVVYVVRKQPNPLAVYYAPCWQSVLDEFDRQVQAQHEQEQ